MSSLARSPGEVGVAKLCRNVTHAVVKVWAIIKSCQKRAIQNIKNVNRDVLHYVLLDQHSTTTVVYGPFLKSTTTRRQLPIM